MNGFSKPKGIVYSSCGTFGGYHTNKDRPKTFTIIDILHYDEDVKKRRIKISPYYFDSVNNEWLEAQSVSDFLL